MPKELHPQDVLEWAMKVGQSLKPSDICHKFYLRGDVTWELIPIRIDPVGRTWCVRVSMVEGHVGGFIMTREANQTRVRVDYH